MPTTPAESRTDIGLREGHISLYQSEQSNLDFPLAPVFSFSDSWNHRRHLTEGLPMVDIQAGAIPHRLPSGTACDGHSCGRDILSWLHLQPIWGYLKETPSNMPD